MTTTRGRCSASWCRLSDIERFRLPTRRKRWRERETRSRCGTHRHRVARGRRLRVGAALAIADGGNAGPPHSLVALTGYSDGPCAKAPAQRALTPMVVKPIMPEALEALLARKLSGLSETQSNKGYNDRAGARKAAPCYVACARRRAAAGRTARRQRAHGIGRRSFGGHAAQRHRRPRRLDSLEPDARASKKTCGASRSRSSAWPCGFDG